MKKNKWFKLQMEVENGLGMKNEVFRKALKKSFELASTTTGMRIRKLKISEAK